MEQEGGGLRRCRRATIDIGEAEAIQINGAAEGGAVRRQWRKEKKRLYKLTGPPRGGGVRRQESGEAEAIQINGAAGGAVRRQ